MTNGPSPAWGIITFVGRGSIEVLVPKYGSIPRKIKNKSLPDNCDHRYEPISINKAFLHVTWTGKDKEEQSEKLKVFDCVPVFVEADLDSAPMSLRYCLADPRFEHAEEVVEIPVSDPTKTHGPIVSERDA